MALAAVVLVSCPVVGRPRAASSEEHRFGALEHEAPSRAPVSALRVIATSAPQPVRMPAALEAPLAVAERPSQRPSVAHPPWRRLARGGSDDPGDD